MVFEPSINGVRVCQKKENGDRFIFFFKRISKAEIRTEFARVKRPSPLPLSRGEKGEGRREKGEGRREKPLISSALSNCGRH